MTAPLQLSSESRCVRSDYGIVNEIAVSLCAISLRLFDKTKQANIQFKQRLICTLNISNPMLMLTKLYVVIPSSATKFSFSFSESNTFVGNQDDGLPCNDSK